MRSKIQTDCGEAGAMANAIESSTGSAGPDSESTQARILDVAERLFAERGLAGTAVRDIAREAGLTAPSLYNHFDGKQALYEAVLARGVQPLFGLIDGLGQADPKDDNSIDVIDAIMDHLASHPNIAKLIQYESLTGGASLSQIAHGWLRPIVAEGLAAMRNNPDTVWSEDEQPMAAAAWIHVILGHFAMAPLLRELFDIDPLAPEQLERQKRFLRRFAQLMMAGSEPPPRD
jgi:AcrR family transcriptional regulator